MYKFQSSIVGYYRVSNCEVLEVCFKLPAKGLPAVADACIRLIIFISDLIYDITCFKHAIMYC